MQENDARERTLLTSTGCLHIFTFLAQGEPIADAHRPRSSLDSSLIGCRRSVVAGLVYVIASKWLTFAEPTVTHRMYTVCYSIKGMMGKHSSCAALSKRLLGSLSEPSTSCTLASSAWSPFPVAVFWPCSPVIIRLCFIPQSLCPCFKVAAADPRLRLPLRWPSQRLLLPGARLLRHTPLR
jgi:hypothetical protein